MLDLAIKVREVYYEIYGEKIPIYKNKNEKVLKYINDKKSTNTYIISNDLIKKNSINVTKKLNEGIYDLFKYLEYSS